MDLRACILARDKAYHAYNGDLGYLQLVHDIGERASSRLPVARARLEVSERALREAREELRECYARLKQIG